MVIIGAAMIAVGMVVYVVEGWRVPNRPRRPTILEIYSPVCVALGAIVTLIGIWEGIL